MDENFLQCAIALAERNLTLGEGGPFGAVIVHEGKIIAEAWNRVVATKDPTAHAEVLAIREASAHLQRFHLSDCTLYASSEPCPMCLAAAYWAKIGRIVFATPRAEAAAVGFCDDALYQELNLAPADRSIPTTQISVAGSADALRDWLADPKHIAY